MDLRLMTGGALFLAVLGAGFAGAQDAPEALLKKVSARYARVRAVSADFRQQERVASLGRTRESGGRLHLQKPGRMRWDYNRPNERLVVSDGEILWLYYPADRTAHRLVLNPDELSRTPLALLFQQGRDVTEFFRAVAMEDAGDGLVRLDLRPVTQRREISSVSLLVEPRGGTIAGTIVQDAFGNRTEVRLSGIIEGAPAEDSLFRFDPPEGTRVLRGQEGSGP